MEVVKVEDPKLCVRPFISLCDGGSLLLLVLVLYAMLVMKRVVICLNKRRGVWLLAWLLLCVWTHLIAEARGDGMGMGCGKGSSVASVVSVRMSEVMKESKREREQRAQSHSKTGQHFV